MGVLVLYHDTFRRPQRLAAHTWEGRESFEIQCARSDCSRYARRPGDAVVRTRGESAIWPAKLVKKNLRKLSHAGPTSCRPRRYYWLGVELALPAPSASPLIRAARSVVNAPSTILHS